MSDDTEMYGLIEILLLSVDCRTLVGSGPTHEFHSTTNESLQSTRVGLRVL